MMTGSPTLALEATASLEAGYPSLNGTGVANRSAGIASRFEPTVAA
jgi:hypothetical protein